MNPDRQYKNKKPPDVQTKKNRRDLRYYQICHLNFKL